jgi:class 3 adenylate cyclase
MERRLAAILAADVVGFSRLIEADEEGTIQALKQCREILDKLIDTHHGRVFGSAGDSVIAEFSSPVEAVRCAVEIQEQLAVLPANLAGGQQMQFRIGINLGDIIAEGDNLLGDGVNIAARLESLADAGGICLSQPVLDQIRKKLDLGYEYLGENTVKNITEPIHVYRVLTQPTVAREIIDKTNVDRRW